jgi:hypothetical protein
LDLVAPQASRTELLDQPDLASSVLQQHGNFEKSPRAEEKQSHHSAAVSRWLLEPVHESHNVVASNLLSQLVHESAWEPGRICSKSRSKERTLDGILDELNALKGIIRLCQSTYVSLGEHSARENADRHRLPEWQASVDVKRKRGAKTANPASAVNREEAHGRIVRNAIGPDEAAAVTGRHQDLTTRRKGAPEAHPKSDFVIECSLRADKDSDLGGMTCLDMVPVTLSSSCFEWISSVSLPKETQNTRRFDDQELESYANIFLSLLAKYRFCTRANDDPGSNGKQNTSRRGTNASSSPSNGRKNPNNNPNATSKRGAG